MLSRASPGRWRDCERAALPLRVPCEPTGPHVAGWATVPRVPHLSSPSVLVPLRGGAWAPSRLAPHSQLPGDEAGHPRQWVGVEPAAQARAAVWLLQLSDLGLSGRLPKPHCLQTQKLETNGDRRSPEVICCCLGCTLFSPWHLPSGQPGSFRLGGERGSCLLEEEGNLIRLWVSTPPHSSSSSRGSVGGGVPLPEGAACCPAQECQGLRQLHGSWGSLRQGLGGPRNWGRAASLAPCSWGGGLLSAPPAQSPLLLCRLLFVWPRGARGGGGG